MDRGRPSTPADAESDVGGPKTKDADVVLGASSAVAGNESDPLIERDRPLLQSAANVDASKAEKSDVKNDETAGDGDDVAERLEVKEEEKRRDKGDGDREHLLGAKETVVDIHESVDTSSGAGDSPASNTSRAEGASSARLDNAENGSDGVDANNVGEGRAVSAEVDGVGSSTVYMSTTNPAHSDAAQDHDNHIADVSSIPLMGAADETLAAGDITVDFGPRLDRGKGLKKYRQTLKTALPFRLAKSPKDVIPIQTNGLINYSTFGWLNPVLWGVHKHGISHVQSLGMPLSEKSEVNAQRMDRFWQEERSTKGDDKASFGKAIAKSFRTRLLIGVLSHLLNAILTLALPIVVIQYFLKYLSEEPEVGVRSGIKYVLVLGLVILLKGVVSSFSWMLNFEAAARIKYGSLALLYRKILHAKSLHGKTEGDLVNFISNDGQRIWDGIIMGPFLIAVLMILPIGSIYCIYYLGPTAIISIFIIIFFFPFMVFLAKMSEKYKAASIKLTDKRVAFITQLLSAVKLVKMCVWETAFLERVSDMRASESRQLSSSVMVMSLNMGLASLVPVVAVCITFVAYVASGNNLTPTEAFTYIAMLNTMQAAMNLIPFALKALAELAVTTRRIQEILVMEEIRPFPALESGSLEALQVVEASFAWSKANVEGDGGDEVSKSKNKKKGKDTCEEEENLKDGTVAEDVTPVLHGLTFSVKKGSLIGVCGGVGSGKSSLLNAILGRMELQSGRVSLAQGQVAYVPQQAWLTSTTIRENILLDASFDPDRYNAIVEACALTEDFKTFPAGDLTEVLDGGSNLSGGQKQRLCLARAVYSLPTIALVDDPLSALDTKVAGHVFHHCIRELLVGQGSTVLMVSHQPKYLKECDEIIVIKNGSVAELGSHDQLVSQSGEYASLIRELQEEKTDKSQILGNGGVLHNEESSTKNSTSKPDLIKTNSTNHNDSSQGVDSKSKQTGNGRLQVGKTVQEEAIEAGGLAASVYGQYVGHMGGVCVVAAVVALAFVVPVAGQTAVSFLITICLEPAGGTSKLPSKNLTIGSNQSSSEGPPVVGILDSDYKQEFLIAYPLLVLALLLYTPLKAWLVAKVTLSASNSIHNSAIKNILSLSMAFFDATPVGRMVNRFSADLDEVDSRLHLSMDVFLTNCLQIFGALAMIAYVSPWFLIAVVPLGALFALLWSVFHGGVRQFKMLDNVTRSPAVSHLGSSVQGAPCIHAFGRTQPAVAHHCRLLDANCVGVFLFYSANRWWSLRLDLVCAAIAMVTGLLVLLTYDSLNPALAGLALTYTIQMSGLFQFASRLAVEAEARMSSAQRIMEYCNISESEDTDPPPKSSTAEVSAAWPYRGELVFNSVKLRYNPSAPLALCDVSFEVGPGEKIGIVGRTGAGKSSLSTALFRLVDLESGAIVVDGLDISTIPLSRLRTSLSTIPQDPTLFTGSLRYNLDPYKEFKDADLWQALEKCHIKDVVQRLDHQLSFEVSEGGGNFSLGEKQLLCMARSLLRDSKIVVLDEATASIDPDTDRLLQQTITEAFHGCTVLVIAHRLSSVLNCDKIMVLDEGKISEFDTPDELMANPDSKFNAMLHGVHS